METILTSFRRWFRSNISRRWVNRIVVKDLTELLIPVNDRTIRVEKWMHFLDNKDHRFMVTSPDLFTNHKMTMLSTAHCRIRQISLDQESYTKNIKSALLEI